MRFLIIIILLSSSVFAQETQLSSLEGIERQIFVNITYNVLEKSLKKEKDGKSIIGLSGKDFQTNLSVLKEEFEFRMSKFNECKELAIEQGKQVQSDIPPEEVIIFNLHHSTLHNSIEETEDDHSTLNLSAKHYITNLKRIDSFLSKAVDAFNMCRSIASSTQGNPEKIDDDLDGWNTPESSQGVGR